MEVSGLGRSRAEFWATCLVTVVTMGTTPISDLTIVGGVGVITCVVDGAQAGEITGVQAGEIVLVLVGAQQGLPRAAQASLPRQGAVEQERLLDLVERQEDRS